MYLGSEALGAVHVGHVDRLASEAGGVVDADHGDSLRDETRGVGFVPPRPGC